MVEGEVNSAVTATNGLDSHLDDSEPPDSQPVAERDPSERYSRVSVGGLADSPWCYYSGSQDCMCGTV